LISLEVIPGDAYRVEKTGRDKAGGYVTKVVYNTDSAAKADSEENMKEEEEEKKHGGMENKIDKKKERRKKQKEKKKEMLKRKIMSDSDIDNDHDDTKDDDDDRGASTTSTKKKRTKLSTNSNDGDLGNDTPISEIDKESNADMPDENDEAITNLRTSWSIHAPGIVLHTTLCAGLVTLGYDRPTPIQSSSLPAAMLGRRDIVGAAPTGSGKTLGYGLPILQYLLEEADGMKEQDESATKSIGQHEGDDSYRSTLQALILVPTRELAMQVTSELTRVSCNKVKIGTIVGGFAEVKQRRTLEKVRPPIVVATPGRLWELVSCFTFYCACLVFASRVGNERRGASIDQ
jgi:ATP-dependent RNA helicase DDX24/MAK5